MDGHPMDWSEGHEALPNLAVDVAHVQRARLPKRSDYIEAADPARYRVKDAALFTCRAHTDAAVLCTTAGKNGRNGRTAAVGATILWLTCPYINHEVARLERHGGVQTAVRCFAKHGAVRERHVASHAVYRSRAQELLQADQWSFFHEHFVSPPDATATKYGNAAVCHEADLKCLHALAGQSLGGASNPLGDAVLNYIRFCHQLLGLCGDGKGDAPVGDAVSRAQVAAWIESERLFCDFLAQTVAAGKDQDGTRVDIHVAATSPDGPAPCVTMEWISNLSRLQQLRPDVCECCGDIAVFLDGKLPRSRRKHRLH